jgi:hypothetical protein
MSRQDAVMMASRSLAVLMLVWGLSELCNLPEYLNSYFRYGDVVQTSSVSYWHHYYLLRICFLMTRAIGFFLLSRWLFKGGPEVYELLLPAATQEISGVSESQ